MLFLENTLQALFLFNGLRSHHCQRALLGYHYHIEEAEMHEINLQEANLSVDLVGLALRRHVANLQGAKLYKANLQGANLHEATLQGAVLVVANFKGTDLSNANLAAAVFELEPESLPHVLSLARANNLN
jgi:uncharacterized protein YjbI with pentapeptide repeats